MAVVTQTDPHLADEVTRAINIGASESTVESQMVAAVTRLGALTVANSADATRVTAAQAVLNTALAHLRDPIHH